VSRLVRVARGPRASERAEAITALGHLGDVTHRALIAAALEDPSPAVRLASALALRQWPPEPTTEIRREGRARIEEDPAVRAALAGDTFAPSAAPLRVQVEVHDGTEATPQVEVALADGRVLVLAPVDGEITLFGVPDHPASVHWLDRAAP
jgi:HEAT repeat protein